MKKAQGLPLNMIVLAVIAALILVLVIAFTIGGAGTFFGKIFKGGITAVGDETSVVQDACRADCTKAQQSISTAAWKTTSYCRRTSNIDLDGSGKIGGYDANGAEVKTIGTSADYNANKQQEKGLSCWESPITVTCSTTIGTSTVSGNDPDCGIA